MITFKFDKSAGYQIKDDRLVLFHSWDFTEAVGEFVKIAMSWIKEHPND